MGARGSKKSNPSSTRARRDRSRTPVLPALVFGRRPEQVDAAVFGLIAAVTLLRLAYTLVIADYAAMSAPMSGPDSPVYSRVAIALHERGIFAGGLQMVPFWPAGYPVFVATVYSWVGPGVIGPIVLQQLLLSGALVSLYRLASREFSQEVGALATALAALSPALNFSASVFMYEPLLAAAVVVATDLVSSAARRTGSTAGWRLGTAMLLLGLGGTLQPKVLAVAPLLAAWLVWRNRTTWVLLPLVLLVALGPATLIARNWVADGAPFISANLGFTMLMGLNDHARGGYVDDDLVSKACEGRETSYDTALDRVWRNCALDWARAHPVRAAALTPAKAAHFWLPMAGTLARYGTWQHPVDPQRWLTRFVSGRAALQAAGAVLGALWTLATVALLVRGAIVAWRRWRPGAILALGPVVLFLSVTLVTIGDGRFRIPVTPFSAMLVAVALHPWVRRHASRR